jgi:hypothetical protein
MDINRKYIIIFGTLILLLVIITGGIVYYKERVSLVKQDEYFSAPIPEDKEYEIWCYNNTEWVDCSRQSGFYPQQLVSITINLEKFNNIPYDPYYLCYYSDLSNIGERCFPRAFSELGNILLQEETVPEDQDIFTLIEISIYPNNLFKEQEKMILMDLKGEII